MGGGVDTNIDRCNKIFEVYGVKTYPSIEMALASTSFDCCFVCTSPLAHRNIILQCLNHGMHIFTELNVVSDGYDEMIALAEKKQKKLFLSSTLNYRKDIQYIQNKVGISNKKCVYSYHVGQYLPDWHPWESYKNFFVANKRSNGCREIMAVDLPWIVKCFGKIASFSVNKFNISSLDIDYPDTYMINLNHCNGSHGVFIVDIVCRTAVRELEIYSEDMQIRWSGHPTTLRELDLVSKEFNYKNCYETELDNNENYSKNIIENAYCDEIIAFFNYVKNDQSPLYSFYDDKEVLDVIDQIEG